MRWASSCVLYQAKRIVVKNIQGGVDVVSCCLGYHLIRGNYLSFLGQTQVLTPVFSVFVWPCLKLRRNSPFLEPCGLVVVLNFRRSPQE